MGAFCFLPNFRSALHEAGGKKNSSNSQSNSLYKEDSMWFVEEQPVFCVPASEWPFQKKKGWVMNP